MTRIEDVSPVAVLASGDARGPPPRPVIAATSSWGTSSTSRDVRRSATSPRRMIVTDFPEPVGGEHEGAFRRTLKLETSAPVEGLYVRAATGSSIEPGPNGSYVVDKLWSVKLRGGVLRDSNGRKELVVRSHGKRDAARS